MVKTYLKYELKNTVGQIVSNASNIVTYKNKYLFSACNDFVICFDLKTAEIKVKLRDQKEKITQLAVAEGYLAVGYENGSVSVVDLSQEPFAFSNKKFFNHKSTVTSLSFNSGYNYLLSGSYDTNLIIYDIIGETALYKFIGHKDNVIKCEFYSQNEDYIISLSKDNSFKIWNVKNQVCVFTHVDLIHKICYYLNIENVFLFGSFDEKVKIFELGENPERKDALKPKGTLTKQSKNKVAEMSLNDDENIFSILNVDGSIEFFKCLSKKEIKHRLIKNIMTNDKNEKRDKLVKKDKYKEVENKIKLLMEKNDYNYIAKYKSVFQFERPSKSKKEAKIVSLSHLSGQRFAFSTNKNEILIYYYASDMFSSSIYTLDKSSYTIKEMSPEEDKIKCEESYAIDSFGHREAVRYAQFSSSSHHFITLSNDSVKLWNFETLNVIKTSQEIQNATCATFVNKDNYILVCNRKGDIFLLHTHSFNVEAHVAKAHENSIWSAVVFMISKTKARIITCSTDKTIKYWDLVFDEENSKTTIDEYNTMTIIDSVTYCMISPDRKYLAYSLMDNSIKVIYEDTQKFFLTLYGHKMPVSSFDISSDGNLLVSGSADKNVKIWGMDFGDCHKSFFAHNDIVTCVKFVNQTHFFFSASKDHTLKYYDADVFELVMEFSDFYDSIWWFDINKEGTNIIAVSADFSIKSYEITEEQTIPRYTQEEKLEKLMNEEAEKELNKKDSMVNPLNKEIDSVVPIKKRMDNIGYAEGIMDALNLCEKYKEEVYQYEISMEEYKKSIEKLKTKSKKEMEGIKAYNLELPEKPVASPMMLGKNIFDYMLWQIKMIRSSELESSLNNIPYSYFQNLLFYFEYYIRNNIEVELIGRCVLFFSYLYQAQISNDKTILRYMMSIKKNLKSRIELNYDLLNFNVKGIELILRNNSIREKTGEEFNNLNNFSDK